MSFEVRLHPNVAKFLDGLPAQLAERIKDKLRECSAAPFQFLERYEGADYYKLRVGDYRALVDVDFERKILWVRVLDKRGRVYKRKR